MSNTLDVWELKFDEELNPYGVHGASLVENPAIEIEAVCFSKEEEDLVSIKMANEEKRIVLSPLLIPNKKVYRASIGKNKEQGFTFVSEETIEKLQQNFFKNNFNHNSSIEHETPIEGVYIFESWIVENSAQDKSALYGYNLPVGSWVVAMKIENQDIWDNYIKTGKVKGLSIDALLRPEKQTFNNNNEQVLMKKELIDSIVSEAISKVAMASDLQEFKISEELSVYGTSLEMGSILVDKDNAPLANLEFDFDGNKYKTDDMGVVVEVEAIEADDTEAPVEDVNQASEIETKLAEVETKLAEKEAMVLDLESKVASLEEENAKLKEELTLSKEEVVAMKSETPATELGVDEIEYSKQKPESKRSASPLEAIRNVLSNK